MHRMMKTSLVSVGMAFLGMVVLFASFFLSQNLGGLSEQVVWTLAYSLLSVAIVWWYFRGDGLRRLFSFKVCLLVMGIGYGLFGFVLAIIGQLVFRQLSIVEIQGINVPFLLEGLILCLGIAIGEELLFRGFMLEFLRKHYGIFWSVLFSSILFSLIHIFDLRNAMQLSNILLIGIFLALLTIYSKSLWGAIGFHWVWNFLDMYVFTVDNKELDGVVLLKSLSPFGTGGETSLLVALVALCLSLFVLARLYEKDQIRILNLGRQKILALGILALVVIGSAGWVYLETREPACQEKIDTAFLDDIAGFSGIVGVVAEGYGQTDIALARKVLARQGFCDRPFDLYRSCQGTVLGRAVLEVAPNVQLATALVLENDPYTDRHVAAIEWLVASGAEVLVIPWPLEMYNGAVKSVVDEVRDRGIIVIWPGLVDV